MGGGRVGGGKVNGQLSVGAVVTSVVRQRMKKAPAVQTGRQWVGAPAPPPRGSGVHTDYAGHLTLQAELSDTHTPRNG